MKLNFFIAWRDGTLATQVHEVETKSKRMTDHLAKWAREKWEQEKLASQIEYRDAVLVAVGICYDVKNQNKG